MDEKILIPLESCALFRGFDKSKIAKILEKSKADLHSFSVGDEFHPEKEGCRKIGILLSGTMTVFAPGEENTPLNHLKPGSLFGVSALFGSPGAKTRICGTSEGEIIFISEEHAEILWEDKVIRRNLISFLTNRICFLNRKIASFTAKGATGKLARHLSQCADAKGVCSIASYSVLAKELHLGRASLYRAMDKLEEDGIIQRDKKVIRILNPESISMPL